jgi:hypothetical protein
MPDWTPEAYLQGLDLAGPDRQRIDMVVAAFQFMSRDQPLDRIFIADIEVPGTGERQLESVWGFAGPYWMEARNFRNQFDVDVSPYAGSIYYLGMQYRDITFPSEVSDTSRLVIEIRTAERLDSRLSAVGKNCAALLAIVKDLFLPSVRTSPDGVVVSPVVERTQGDL